MILASCYAELLRKCENEKIAKLNNKALSRKPPVYTKLYILFSRPILLDLKHQYLTAENCLMTYNLMVFTRKLSYTRQLNCIFLLGALKFRSTFGTLLM